MPLLYLAFFSLRASLASGADHFLFKLQRMRQGDKLSCRKNSRNHGAG